MIFPRQRGAAVWQFPGNATRGLLMAEMQEQGIRVLLESDDNYFVEPAMYPGAFSDWQKHLDRSKEDKASYEAHRRIARFVDGVIVSTPKLAEWYRTVNDHVYVCPNSVDPDDWPAEPPHQQDGLVVGWAGSFSHYYDVAHIREALDWTWRLDAKVVTIGLDPGWTFPRTHLGWADDLAEYREKLQVLDVGLCPLRPGPWEDCKSDVKALEYAMAGACPVVSRTEPYRPWWEGWGWPYVAQTEKEWAKVVRHLVAHPEEVRDGAREVRRLVLSERAIERTAWRWEEAIGDRPDSRNVRSVPLGSRSAAA